MALQLCKYNILSNVARRPLNGLCCNVYRLQIFTGIYRGISSTHCMGCHAATGATQEDNDYETFFNNNHITTSSLQKVLLATGSGLMSILNPARDDMIAVFGESTAQYALPYMREEMLKHESGREILRDKPRVTSATIDIDTLRSLPDDTFGKAYSNFLDTNGISPDSRRPVQFVADAELSYVMQRYREIHDLVHTLLGMPTNMLGEVAVKWVEAVQFRLPMCVLAALVGPVRLGPRDSAKYMSAVLPWAVTVGRACRHPPLIAVHYERLFGERLGDVRDRLRIPPPPRVLKLRRPATHA